MTDSKIEISDTSNCYKTALSDNADFSKYNLGGIALTMRGLTITVILVLMIYLIGCSTSKEFLIQNTGRLDFYPDVYRHGFETDIIILLELEKGVIKQSRILRSGGEEMFDMLLLRLAKMNKLDLSTIRDLKRYDSVTVRVQFCLLPEGEKIKSAKPIQFKSIDESDSADAVTDLDIASAASEFDRTLNMSTVTITFTETGKQKFESLTARNLDRPVSIILDGYVISKPTVKEQIKDGRVMITGLKPYAAKYVADRINKLCKH